jgi:transmembrane sensor
MGKAAPMKDRTSSELMLDAERWFARLKAPDCGAAERGEFERWQSVPEHAAAFAATTKLWESFGALAGRPELEALSRKVLRETESRRWAAAWWRPAALAAAILIAVLAGWGYLELSAPQRPAPVVYATGPGERSTVKLADGSQVVLNFATELDVHIDEKSRRVTLRKGEALFSVVGGKGPFIVEAGDGEVRVLGTRFQVRNEASNVAVTLIEGHVAVERPERGQSVQINPGEQLRFTQASSDLTRSRVDPAVATSWTTGRLLFRSTPLSEVVAEVNRYSDVQIRLADPSLAGIPISGTFELGDSDSIVTALQALLPVQVSKEGHATILSRRP